MLTLHGVQVWVAWEWHPNAQRWVDPRLLSVSFNLCVVVCLSVLHGTPSILGRHSPHTKIGSEYENAVPEPELAINFPQFLTSPYWDCAVRTQRCWEVNVWAFGCHLGEIWNKPDLRRIVLQTLSLHRSSKTFSPKNPFWQLITFQGLILLYWGCPRPHNYFFTFMMPVGPLVLSFSSPSWIQNIFLLRFHVSSSSFFPW